MTMRTDGKKALIAAGWKSSPEQEPYNSPPINGGLLCIGVSEGALSRKEQSPGSLPVRQMKYLFDKKSEKCTFFKVR